MMQNYLLLAAALALNACAGMPSIATMPTSAEAIPDVSAVRPNTTLVDVVVREGNRALVLAALAYDSAAKIAIVAVEEGGIRGTALDKLKELNGDATVVLMLGYTASSAAEKARAAASLDRISQRIRDLAP